MFISYAQNLVELLYSCFRHSVNLFPNKSPLDSPDCGMICFINDITMEKSIAVGPLPKFLDVLLLDVFYSCDMFIFTVTSICFISFVCLLNQIADFAKLIFTE